MSEHEFEKHQHHGQVCAAWVYTQQTNDSTFESLVCSVAFNPLIQDLPLFAPRASLRDLDQHFLARAPPVTA